MNTRKRLRSLSKQRRLISDLFGAATDAAERLKDCDGDPAVDGLLADALTAFEADLREVVGAITNTERSLIARFSGPKLGGG